LFLGGARAFLRGMVFLHVHQTSVVCAADDLCACRAAVLPAQMAEDACHAARFLLTRRGVAAAFYPPPFQQAAEHALPAMVLVLR
jgi:hypothetical protein